MRGTIVVLILLNIVLAVRPPSGQPTTSGLINCCKEQSAGAYCCQRCCWLAWRCRDDADCHDN